MADSTHVKVLIPFRLNGVHRAEGEVIAKADFKADGEWKDLVNMEPARAEEVDAPKTKLPEPK